MGAAVAPCDHGGGRATNWWARDGWTACVSCFELEDGGGVEHGRDKEATSLTLRLRSPNCPYSELLLPPSLPGLDE